ncbi:MAG: hypothetical protein IPL93_13055 [Actinomycetales bacterium]|nr:hypothetical protein [Actinomycetales bacterium]
MSLWDELPEPVRSTGALDGLRPLLDGLTGSGPVETSDADGFWSTYTATEDLTGPLALDPRTGAFTSGGSGGGSGTPIEFADPHVVVTLSFHLTGTGGSRDGGWKVELTAPSLRIRMPFLRGAMLDSFGHLRADTSKPTVAFTLPAVKVRVRQLAGAAVSVDLMSATIGPGATDQIYEFIEMDPPYALVGPSDTVGFAFQTAVLDLSGTAGPSGVPASARAMPAAWQGFFLPDARLFVAPDGLEGLSVMAGVRNLWIGIGVHEGVTGLFEAEVVNRGQTPSIVVRFVTDTGAQIAYTGDSAQVPEHTTVYAESSGGLGGYDISIVVDGTTTSSDRVSLTTPATGTVSVEVRLHPVGQTTVVTSRTLTVSRSAAAVGGGSGAGAPVTLRTTSHETAYLVLVSQTTTEATVRLSSNAAATWTWPGGTASGATATIPVATGAPVSVSATTTAAAQQTLDCYFLFDHPKVDEGSPYAVNPANTHTAPATDRTHPSASALFIPDAQARRAVIGAGTRLTVSGYASYEGDPSAAQEARNLALSERRRQAMIDALGAAGYTNLVAGEAAGTAKARAGTSIDGAPAPAPGASAWWRARAVSDTPAAPVTVTGELQRPALPDRIDRDPRPPRSNPPDCFHKLGVRVELVRSTFVRCEIYGEFDIETAAESNLRRKGQAQPLRATGSPRNPNDGICTFLVRLRIAEDQGSWEISGEFRAKEGDLDGLAQMTSSNSNATPLNILGALAVLAPLTASATTLSPAAGAVVALGSVALGASDLLHTSRLTLRGAEVIVSQGILGSDGITTVDQRGTQVVVLVDVEIAFSFDLTLVRVDPAHPIVTRYKAIGVRSSWGTSPGVGNSVDYIPLPVFFPERGYSLDIPAGSLTAAPPLDNILRILGVRVSRDNPTYLEVEVGLGLDLGVITIETVRVRARVDGPPLDLQLTKFGASVDIPNVLTGRGYVSIESTGFSGSFDLQVIPLKLRATASIAVRQSAGVTGVLLGIEVEFPVPLVLGSSGLGMFGVLAGVGINHGRLEDTTQTVPALAWLQQQFARPGGVMDPQGWGLMPGHYAFAAGVLLGTLEGGYVVHLKGIVVIEVPGPRLLFVMKADVIKAPPVLKSNQSATFLAVLDLDFGRGTITIGIVAAYEIEKILKIRVPVTAFFDTNQVEKWFVDLGSYTDRVTVEVLDVISGSGYLMIHGDGTSISIPGLPAPGNGMAIATGFHISAVLMGSKSIGLYLEVAAGFDALIAFDPFFVAGKIYARGELRLFIISISASAELTVIVGKREEGGVLKDQPYVHGKVCGSIDLFFFEISGCVELTIGAEPTDNPTPKDLIAGVSLVSRSPALVEGSAVDRAVDGTLGDAHDLAKTLAAGEHLLVVPLDAIPVLSFDAIPTGLPGTVMGGTPLGHSGAEANPWQKIGDRWWRYELQSVTLTGGPLLPADGKTPSTWWTGRPPGTPVPRTALALLNWLPTPFSRAVPYGEELVRSIDQRWGTVCHPAAPAAPVLWTFDGKPPGPNPAGWRLHGIPWPDPPETIRTAPVDADLAVSEPWRTHDPVADLLQGTEPAIVVSDYVPCTHSKTRATVRRMTLSSLAKEVSGTSNARLPQGEEAQTELLEHLAAGMPLGDFAATRATTAWDAGTSPDPVPCTGAILRSPVFDLDRPAPRGTPEDQKVVQKVWGAQGFKPDPLRDAVRFEPSDAPRELALLLFVPRTALELGLMVRLEKADGTPIREQQVSPADIVGPGNALPAQLSDPAGPWFDPLSRAARMAARVAASSTSVGHLAVYVTLRDLRDDLGAVVVGYRTPPQGKDDDFAPFYVVAVTGLLASEVTRQDYDETIVSDNKDALQTALVQDPDDRALLSPGVTYRVAATWRAAWVKQDARPAASTTPTWQPAKTQTFEFATAPASDSPQNLTPWLLATAPGMDDVGVFCREPVRIVFATQKVAALFAAYGKELRVLVRSASGAHPEPPGGGAPGDPFTVPLTASAYLAAAAIDVQTPWEEAVRKVLADNAASMPCIDTSGERHHQETLTLPYDFEPLTDYLIDIHAVPIGSPVSARGLVHRIGFTTSRFNDLDDFVSYLAPASVRHRLIPTPAGLTALVDKPTGDQVDTAYQAAGLPVPQTPRFPAVEVLWSGDAVPQPIALVIESSEPLWRSRIVPKQVTGPIDAADPTHHWWAGRPDDWLTVRPNTTPLSPTEPRAGITRVVRCPGDTRAIAFLAPGSRGREARLDLVLPADVLAGLPERPAAAARVSLQRAPWEVED